jgi:hypothetical protein
MLYAMSNENYADYQRLMFELHKTIIDFAFESTALIHFENFCGNKDRYKKKSVLLVDIAEEHMHLTIFENYSITYTVVADLNTKELIDCQLDDVYDKKSILYRIYFEIEKVVNFYNVSAGKPIDVTIKTSYPLPEKYIEICAESLGANIHTIKNSKSRLARGKRLIHEETYFKSLGVANKARQKEAQIKLKFKKIKTYGSRLSATILVGIICAFLLLFTTTDFINSLYEYNRVNDSYETRKNELLKLTDINNSIAEFNKFEEIVSVIQNIDQTEVDINYLIDRVATLRREEALISNFSYSANNELVFTYTDVDVEVMYFISRLEKEEWVLAIEYSELFYNEGLAEVRITAIMDSSKITFDALRRDN